ncbi:MAG TPA: ATP-binding protein [Herpetosiphonaceae bacterium]|nr:ATP-binding protein [Herpetosiphonaceae bacterium]
MIRLRTRLLINNVLTLTIVLLIIVLVIVRTRTNVQLMRQLNQIEASSRQARELSLYVHYNTHDMMMQRLQKLSPTSGPAINNSREIIDDANTFNQLLADIKGNVNSGLFNQQVARQLDRITSLRYQYDIAAIDLDSPGISSYIHERGSLALQAIDNLDNELDQASRDLVLLIDSDANTIRERVRVYNQQVVTLSLSLGVMVALMLSLVQRVSSSALGEPFQALLAGVQSFTSSNLTTRVPVVRQDELGDLTAAFNEMAMRLEHQTTQLMTQTKIAESARTEAQLARAAAEEANALKTTFLATMSHELRTPLNSIIGFSQIIPRYGPVNERQRHWLQRITSNGEHLLGLINDILDLAKVEAGRLDLVPEWADVSELVDSVISTTLGLLGEKEHGLDLHVECAESMPRVWMDATRIRQVLLNLLSNAIKFTVEGEVILKVSFDETTITFAVTDTGIGIAPEFHKAVFEEFHQVQDGLTREYSGTGLGLPIAKRLVELHDGHMWLESTPDVGSTFSFSLPLGPGAAPGPNE